MESMEEIYQNHSKKVYTFLLSKTCNHELAEQIHLLKSIWKNAKIVRMNTGRLKQN